MFLSLLRIQNMSGATFKSIIEGKRSKFEEKIKVDPELLSKLEEYGIITNIQRTATEVTLVVVWKF